MEASGPLLHKLVTGSSEISQCRQPIPSVQVFVGLHMYLLSVSFNPSDCVACVRRGREDWGKDFPVDTGEAEPHRGAFFLHHALKGWPVLCSAPVQGRKHWRCVVRGEPEIDTMRCVPRIILVLNLAAPEQHCTGLALH